jgi:hypothetical protein
MKSYCANCNKLTNQIVINEKPIKIYNDEDWWEETTYQIIQCGGCDEISFRKLFEDTYMWAMEKEPTQELYPKRGVHSRPIKSYSGLPQKIKRIYGETMDAYNSQLHLLCGVGIRAIVEAICLEKKITEGKVKMINGKERKSKNLDGKIAALSIKGFLTADNAETLQELRFLGNSAVHELSPPSIAELDIAIDIIEHTIDDIYMLGYKAAILKNKRTSKKK